MCIKLHIFLPEYNFSLLIDCGGKDNFTSQFNQSWTADEFYTGGSTAVVSNTGNFIRPQETTLRFFPISYGKKNCYNVDVPNGRYFIRTFTVYDNYDNKMQTPNFDVSVEGTLVFSWRSPWGESFSRNGAYADLFAFINDGQATICFYSIATDAPVIASLEIIQVDPLSYVSSSTGMNLILVNYGRFSCGSQSFGPGFTNDTDYFGRNWQTDALFFQGSPDVGPRSTTTPIHGADQAPDYFPERLYQTALTTIGENGNIEFILTVDARTDYMIWFHFAEIDPRITKSGERVFDIYINGKNVNRVDIFEQVGNYTAFTWNYILRKLNSTLLRVRLVPVVGAPLICGLENYAMLPLDYVTVPSQVLAMRALKESLQIPDRMGWNGDPCAPSTWDAWEGVTCHNDENRLVITHLDLGTQGLKGYVSDQINLLTNLLSLNLSSNGLTGNIPSGLGGGSLVQLDLSHNMLSGAIPDSLGSSNLQVVLLDDNELEGQVPDKLYSVGLHGGMIDLSSNKGLCGVPTLPDCPFSWSRGSLSSGAKIAIILASITFVLLLGLLIYVVFIRKGRNDYDFGLPQDLSELPFIVPVLSSRFHSLRNTL
ncbi:putative LRR receptor-like serine/threonine-protein kinase [Nymphaea thermarum]|nr:putative LRR receptor-like serine/threonine-protein kinase [Nymphaea thermarum]